MTSIVGETEFVPKDDEHIVIDLAETDYYKALGERPVFEGRSIATGTFWMFDGVFDSHLEDWCHFATLFSYNMKFNPDIKDVRINLVDNAGGRVTTAFAIYDGIRTLAREFGVEISVLAMGVCASAAAQIIMQAGDHRMATEHALFLAHEISSTKIFSHETVSDMKDQQTGVDRMTSMMYELMAKRCGKTVEEIKKFVERHERWMTATEALEFGLIDEVVEV